MAGRRVAGQVVEQPAVIEAVRTLAAPGSEVQHADELALRHERHDDVDARRAHRVEGRRLQVEVLHRDRLGVLLQVEEQRVVLGHVEGRGRADRRLRRRRRRRARRRAASATTATSRRRSRRVASRRRRALAVADPERHLRRVHRVRHDRDELVGQLVEVDLVAHVGGEGLQRADGVELLPVEPPVDRRLEPPADRAGTAARRPGSTPTTSSPWSKRAPGTRPTTSAPAA